MAYNFKNLADIELLNAMPEKANIVVEVDGKTKRAPQVQIPEPVDEIALIVGSETLEEVPEGATVLAEVNGEIKRVPSDGLGGGIDTIIFSVIEATSAAIETPTYQTVCNHTLEEVRNLMLAGAGCILIMPYAAMTSAASTLQAGGTTPTPTPTPTVMTMPAVVGMQSDDGSVQFMFMSNGGAITVTYNADGTITNSLLSA